MSASETAIHEEARIDSMERPRILDGENIAFLFELLRDGGYCVDLERRIHHWNSAAERITGYGAEEVVGSFCFVNILQHIDDEGRKLCSCDESCPLFSTMRDRISREKHVSLLHKDGRRVPITIRTMPICDCTGECIGALEVFHEDEVVETLRDQLQCMAKKAFVDCLTGLPNRHSIEDRLQQSLDEWERYGWPFACFISDIDHFKRINDTCGHDAGDQAISTVMNTMSMACRTSDMVGRWGGDEAVGILKSIDAVGLDAQLHRISVLVREVSVCRDSFNIAPTISIGATLPQAGDTVQSILKRADLALYESKHAGRDRYTIV